MSEFATGRVIPGNGEVLAVSYGDDSGMFVEFYWREIENAQKTQEAGRPIFESKEYVRIMAVGDKTKQWDRPVRKTQTATEPSDLQRFPRQWQAFQNQETQSVSGTPITEWAAITRADAMSLKAMNIHTVEMLAELGEHNLTWTGSRGLRDKAKLWIEKAKDGASASQWAKEKAEMQAQIDGLKNMIQGLTNAGAMPKQEASASPVRNKPGPKPKVKEYEQDVSTIDAGSL